MGVSSHLSGHGLAAPGHCQVALVAKKVALGPGPPGPGHAPAPLSSSQAPLGHGPDPIFQVKIRRYLLLSVAICYR